MRKNIKQEIIKLIWENFWGITYTLAAILSIILIMIIGIGPFIIMLLVGVIFFIIGNSKDKNISPLENLRNIIKEINKKIQSLKNENTDN